MGPTPKPHIPTLRPWFFRLMERYKPYYMPNMNSVHEFKGKFVTCAV
ncbi:MAG: hypothetical protein ACFFKA_20580 [Candidatus Thorarchaeota archaeon]